MGFGVEPGMADWYCRYAADHFFDEIDEIGVRDGANLEIPGFKGISFGFSIWMTIEECTNPAVVWERDRGFYTVPPLSDPEPFYLPEGIGWVDVPTSSTRKCCTSAASSTCSRASRRRPSSTRWATSSSRPWRSSSRSTCTR